MTDPKGAAFSCRRVMPIECWTILHHLSAPIASSAKAAGHVIKPLHRAVHAAVRPTMMRRWTWIEIVCRTTVIGGGALLPQPASPPVMPQPVPPGSVAAAWPPPPILAFQPSGPMLLPPTAPGTVQPLKQPVSVVPHAVPEPASLLVLIVGAGGTVLLRWRGSRR